MNNFRIKNVKITTGARIFNFEKIGSLVFEGNQLIFEDIEIDGD